MSSFQRDRLEPMARHGTKKPPEASAWGGCRANALQTALYGILHQTKDAAFRGGRASVPGECNRPRAAREIPSQAIPLAR
jgi:hypothetical protein